MHLARGQIPLSLGPPRPAHPQELVRRQKGAWSSPERQKSTSTDQRNMVIEGKNNNNKDITEEIDQTRKILLLVLLLFDTRTSCQLLDQQWLSADGHDRNVTDRNIQRD